MARLLHQFLYSTEVVRLTRCPRGSFGLIIECSDLLSASLFLREFREVWQQFQIVVNVGKTLDDLPA